MAILSPLLLLSLFPPLPPLRPHKKKRRRRLVLDRPIVLFLLLPSPLSSCEWRGRPGPNRRRYGPRVSGKLSPRKKKRRKKRGPIYRRRGLYCCLDENFSTKKCLFQNQNSPSIDDESLLFSFLGQRGKRGGKRGGGGGGTPFVFAMNGKIDERAEERDIYVYTHAYICGKRADERRIF